jgi:peptidyl-prolyl cis-trans isomerase A (cyclophilin A)
MNKIYAAFFICTLLNSCNANKNIKIVIETKIGNIDAELYADKAPITVAAFVNYVDSGYFKNSNFYRVVYNDVFGNDDNAGAIQGGIWQSNNAFASKLPGIPHESPTKTGLTHTSGTLSLARTTAGSANTEFFICIGDQTGYDKGETDGLGFAALGKVTNGMNLVRQIHQQPTKGEAIDKPVIINNIRRL